VKVETLNKLETIQHYQKLVNKVIRGKVAEIQKLIYYVPEYDPRVKTIEVVNGWRWPATASERFGDSRLNYVQNGGYVYGGRWFL